MYNSLDTLLIFTVLAVFNLWGGAALGAGLCGRRPLPVLWGGLIGLGPLYFGIERVIKLGNALPLLCQLVAVAGAACAVAFGLPRLRAIFFRPGMDALMIGTLIMAAAAVVAAVLARNSELLSVLLGGIGFLFGAMWFGAGIQLLRRRTTDPRP